MMTFPCRRNRGWRLAACALLTLTLAGCAGLTRTDFYRTYAPVETPKERVLFVVTSTADLGDTGERTGFYLSEVAHPHHVLVNSGYAVDFVSPRGGDAPIDPRSLDLEDKVNRQFLANPLYVAQVENTMAPADIDPADYAAIYYAGGHGTMFDFPENDPLAAIAAEIYEAGGIVAAVCHGPAALMNIRLSDGSYLVEGKTVACFTNEEEEAVGLTGAMPFLLEDGLKARGAEVVEAAPFQPKFAASERLITGQNPASAEMVGRLMVRHLEGR